MALTICDAWLMKKQKAVKRCPWVTTDEIYQKYHDEEWGRPCHDDLRWFEFLILEGAQAGLSWLTVLKKRQHYRQAFKGFDPVKVARFGKPQIKLLLKNEGLIRHRLKLESAVTNAQAFIKVQKEFGTFDKYIWGFVGGKTIQTKQSKAHPLPLTTKESEALSLDLKRRGFKFVGPTICYSIMQACGLVNDHARNCFLH